MKLLKSSNVVTSDRFWNDQAVIQTQQPESPHLYWYERYLVNYAVHALGKAELIHVIGCGTGRELPIIKDVFPSAYIIASDISASMIETCAYNLEKWGCGSKIKLKCCAASLLSPRDGVADLVVNLSSMMTYVTPESERLKTLNALRSILRSNGLLIGVVHHRWGRLTKSGYFFLQQILDAVDLAPQTLGDRIGGFAGLRTKCHYFTVSELRALLMAAQFAPLEIHSLQSLTRLRGKKYNALAGDNNLAFVSEAC